ncbi:MAG TPA: ATP-binding protein [Gemmataceae bacterium]|nr:ATP-binding protein [Gemmataceae bacterium]
MERASRHFTSDLEQLAEIRTFVREHCQKIWPGPAAAEGLAKLELAVSEAATNIMLHAYERQPGQPIDVLVEGDEGQIIITMYHQGCAFEPESVAPPAFDGSRETGFGVYLIQESVDEVAYLHDGENQSGIRMIKRRKHSR